MAPPKYADLNKQASDIFNKGYCMFKFRFIYLLLIFVYLVFNVFKLDIKTSTANKVNFNVVGEHSTETARTLGSLETKYVVPEYGLTFLEKWNTDNLLKFEVTADDQLAQGFKLVFDGSFAPNTG
jgi:voltage-dependent anion channel protein 2